MNKICDECETVAHCTKHGCIPKVSAKDAMKLALEALETSGDKYPLLERKAITALREALEEQPAQQEPVAWMQDSIELYVQDRPSEYYTIPLYTSPPAQRKPLSVDEIFEAIKPLYSSDKAAWLAVNHSKDEYRAIEAAHNIKEST